MRLESRRLHLVPAQTADPISDPLSPIAPLLLFPTSLLAQRSHWRSARRSPSALHESLAEACPHSASNPTRAALPSTSQPAACLECKHACRAVPYSPRRE